MGSPDPSRLRQSWATEITPWQLCGQCWSSVQPCNNLAKVKRLRAQDVPPPNEGEPDADLAGALHEVSNALTVVLGWLDAARSKVTDGPAREALEVARAHADLGFHIARGAIGVGVGSDGERSAFAVAREARIGVTQEARRQGVRLELDDQRANDAMLRDAASAHQILINLLLNAVAFTPVGGRVKLALESLPMRMLFRVTDEGSGIERERAETILSGPASTRKGGAGIGLSYSAALARSRGGELRLVESERGASFELFWPIEQAQSGAYPKPKGPVSLAGMRVLVVEDDPAVCSLIEFALETHGIEVCSANTQEQLVSLLGQGQRFHAALIDLSPFENGADEAVGLLETAGSEGASLILISGLITRIPPALEQRIAAWVRKPFEMNEVVQVLQQIPRAGNGEAAE
jgi:CheY-like chemotaxis protein